MSIALKVGKRLKGLYASIARIADPQRYQKALEIFETKPHFCKECGSWLAVRVMPIPDAMKGEFDLEYYCLECGWIAPKSE